MQQWVAHKFTPFFSPLGYSQSILSDIDALFKRNITELVVLGDGDNLLDSLKNASIASNIPLAILGFQHELSNSGLPSYVTSS